MRLKSFERMMMAWSTLALVGCGRVSESPILPPLEIVVETTPYTLDPGEETYRCQYFPPTGERQWIDSVSIDPTPGFHHVFVYRMPDGAKEATAQAECADDFSSAGGALLPIVKPGGSFDFPSGIAISVGEQEGILVSMHMLNTAAEPATVQITWRGKIVPAPEVVHPAGMFLFGDRNIDLPPHRETVVSHTCPVPVDASMFFAAGHHHTHTISYRATLAGTVIVGGPSNEGGHHFSPPIPVHAGDPISWSCDDVNDGANDVVYGPSFLNNEMCNFVAYVYPVEDSKTYRCE
jgi:hypothetical protein